MNTGTLNMIKDLLTAHLTNLAKTQVTPENEWRKESHVGLIKVLVSEVDREIESNQKRSERTKRCMKKKCPN